MDFDESLAALASEEALKTEKLLLNLALSLYTPVDTNKVLEPSGDFPLREYSRGYDAHVESVDSKELLIWQKNFTYLHVTGSAISSPHLITGSNCAQVLCIDSNNDDPETLGDYVSTQDVVNMKVVGKQMTIYSRNAHDDDEEILAQDGVLEEYCAFDMSGSSLPEDLEEEVGEDVCVEPSMSLHKEVVDGLLDAVLPDLCAALEPLVRRTVHAGRESGVEYSAETGREEEFGGFFDSDDDGNGMQIVQEDW